jgi:ectoine hydroxylase-related dioxygenase (phytanoyl-CoA dioxygenase family)
MKKTLLKIDTIFGSPFYGFYEYIKLKKRFFQYNNHLQKRIQNYPDFKCNKTEIVKELEENGFIVIKNFLNVEILEKIKNEFDYNLDTGSNLLPVSNDSIREKNDLRPSSTFLSNDDLNKGQKFCRNYTNNMVLKDPLMNINEILKIAFNNEIINITSSYLGTLSGLGGLNLRKSFVNSIPEFDTQYFHIDPNSAKFLKCFFYLNDVDEKGGPFCYIKGSHKKRFFGYSKKYRWTLDEMLTKYKLDDVVNITANVGDLIIADTNGFHRGNPISSNDRYMLTLDYVIHPEFDGNNKLFKISKSDLDNLELNNKGVADFLEIYN